MPISRQNLEDLDVLIPFYKKNADIISFVVFTTLTDSAELKPRESNEEFKIDPELFFSKTKSLYGKDFDYSACLGKIKSDGISWILACSFFMKGELLGSVDQGVNKIILDSHYKKNKKYFFVFNDIDLEMKTIFSLIFNKSLLKIAFNFLLAVIKNGIGTYSKQQLLIINTPGKVNGEWDLCDGCPDAILYTGCVS